MKMFPADIWEYPIPKIGNFSFRFLGKTLDEIQEEFGDSSDSIADIAGEGNIEAKEKGELTALCCVVSPFLCVMKFLNCKAVDCVRNPSGKIRI